MTGFYLLIGAVFSLFAAGMAFLIVWEEYRHHYPEGSRQPVRKAMSSAIVTFLFFSLLTFAISLFMKYLIE